MLLIPTDTASLLETQGGEGGITLPINGTAFIATFACGDKGIVPDI